MSLWIQDRTENPRPCLDCGLDFPHVNGCVGDGERTVAAYFASVHTDEDGEAYIDVVLGTWGMDSSDDHVTFSCKLRRDAAMALDAPLTLTEVRAILGRPLTRAEALSHPKIAEFWDVVDAIAVHDPLVASRVYGSWGGQSRGRTPR